LKLVLLTFVLLLSACATNPSTSRDQTAEKMAKAGLLAEMLKSEDPLVRAQAAKTADTFINNKKNIFGF